MSLCANSNMPFVKYFVMSCVFLIFTCLVIFDWVPHTVDFNKLGARYFCISINILEFFPEVPLIYLETLILLCLASMICSLGPEQSCFSLGGGNRCCSRASMSIRHCSSSLLHHAFLG